MPQTIMQIGKYKVLPYVDASGLSFIILKNGKTVSKVKFTTEKATRQAVKRRIQELKVLKK